VRTALSELAPGLEVLGVEVRLSHSYVDVKPEALEGAIAALDQKPWGDKVLGAEKARRRRR
jgi:ATP-dependent RNA helicase DeaD